MEQIKKDQNDLERMLREERLKSFDLEQRIREYELQTVKNRKEKWSCGSEVPKSDYELLTNCLIYLVEANIDSKSGVVTNEEIQRVA